MPPSATDIPARFSRQVAPSPSTYWRPPDLRDYTRVLKSTEAPADRSEQALRAARADRSRPAREPRDARGVGGGPPSCARRRARRKRILPGARDLGASVATRASGVPIPKNLVSDGFFRFDLAQAVPALNLRWLLLDFGRRGSARDAAKERLLAANLGFNRKHQQIVFAVQRAFYGLTSVRARIAVAQSSLDAARAVQEATEGGLRPGSPRVPSSPWRDSKRPRPSSSSRKCSTRSETRR